MSIADVVDREAGADAETPSALELRRPDIPVTLSELAARKGEALEIIDARVQILSTLRKAALRATSPEDWILFKSPDDQGGQITGYLQDCGGERVRDLFGIEIFDVGKPEKILTNNPRDFNYIISGSGRCKLTRQIAVQVEGGRSSTEDFCKDKKDADLELAVRKAARANLDGRIVRELAGMSNVPLEELKEAWTGTTKKWENCRRGRGFGSRSERLGGTSTRGGAPDVEPPVCPHCNAKGEYRPAKGESGAKDYRRAFYGCPNYQKHPDKKFIVNADKWVEEQTQKAAAAAPTNDAAVATESAAPAPAKNGGKSAVKPAAPMSAGDIPFGGDREPGAEG